MSGEIFYCHSNQEMLLSLNGLETKYIIVKTKMTVVPLLRDSDRLLGHISSGNLFVWFLVVRQGG